MVEYGGLAGRDDPKLEGALGRPKSFAHYNPDADVADVAAVYAIALVKAHAFIDGNKRTAFGVTVLFLHLNGYQVTAQDFELENQWVALAAGDINEEAFSNWLRERVHPL